MPLPEFTCEETRILSALINAAGTALNPEYATIGLPTQVVEELLSAVLSGKQLLEKLECPLSGLEAERRTAKQIGVNDRWLISLIDQVHDDLCPGKTGTWQDRAKQVMAAASEISSTREVF